LDNENILILSIPYNYLIWISNFPCRLRQKILEVGHVIIIMKVQGRVNGKNLKNHT